jgi:hypothetical protein
MAGELKRSVWNLNNALNHGDVHPQEKSSSALTLPYARMAVQALQIL